MGLIQGNQDTSYLGFGLIPPRNHWCFGGGTAAIVLCLKATFFDDQEYRRSTQEAGTICDLKQLKFRGLRCESLLVESYPCVWLKVVDSTLKMAPEFILLDFISGEKQRVLGRRGTVNIPSILVTVRNPQ